MSILALILTLPTPWLDWLTEPQAFGERPLDAGRNGRTEFGRQLIDELEAGHEPEFGRRRSSAGKVGADITDVHVQPGFEMG